MLTRSYTRKLAEKGKAREGKLFPIVTGTLLGTHTKTAFLKSVHHSTARVRGKTVGREQEKGKGFVSINSADANSEGYPGMYYAYEKYGIKGEFRVYSL